MSLREKLPMSEPRLGCEAPAGFPSLDRLYGIITNPYLFEAV